MENYSLLIEFLQDYSLDMFKKYNGVDYYEKEIEELIKLDIKDIVFAIVVREQKILDSTKIPMFSSFNDCTQKICKTLFVFENPGVTIEKIGYLLLQGNQNSLAKYKYGETHSKTAQMLGLVRIEKENGKNTVFLTRLGHFYLNLNNDDKQKLLIRLILKTEIVQYLIKISIDKKIMVKDQLTFLSESSINRRMPNIKKLFLELLKSKEFDFQIIFDKLNFERMG